jgi:hypothetical protein
MFALFVVTAIAVPLSILHVLRHNRKMILFLWRLSVVLELKEAFFLLCVCTTTSRWDRFHDLLGNMLVHDTAGASYLLEGLPVTFYTL